MISAESTVHWERMFPFLGFFGRKKKGGSTIFFFLRHSPVKFGDNFKREQVYWLPD